MSIKDNLRAIAILKTLQAENRQPTKDEIEILKQFNGWGAMWEIFKPDHPKHNELKFWLTEAEFEAANASILNAHYTHPEIVRAVWDCVKHLGFKSGKILEPSCGIGYFLNEQPDNDWTAVELDPIPSAIAQYLYPKATIYNQGFEKVSLPDEYFDLAIGNVPFGSYSVFEPRYDGLLIHNHFISKSIDLLRDGGLIVLITSTGTLDAEGNKEYRKSLAQRATLISAIRMPSGTMSNAKTQVTTDLLIFKRSPEPNAQWIETGEILGLPINQYFIDHPEHLIGKVCKDKLYDNDRLALQSDGRDVGRAIIENIQKLKPCYSEIKTSQDILLIPQELQHLPINSFCLWNQEIYQRGKFKLIHIGKSDRIEANLEIISTVETLLNAQISESDEVVNTLREKLNNQYDRFVRQYGYLASDSNQKIMEADPRYGLLRSLEVNNKKAPIFSQRTTKGYTPPSKCDSTKDALLHCLNVKGKVDLNWIAERC